MLDTLIQIGKIQSQGKDDWDSKIYNPLGKTQLVFLTFNIDEQTIIATPEREFDSQTAKNYRCMKPDGARAKNALVTVDIARNYEQLKKSLFGGNIDSESGEFIEIIKRDCPSIENTMFGKCLLKIFEMKNSFNKYADTEGYLKDKKNVVAVAIIFNELEISKPTALAHLQGFEEYAKIKILKSDNSEGEQAKTEKLCYATGNLESDTAEVDFSNRFSLNKMFVTTTKNYISDFQDSNSIGNYQVSIQNQKYLEGGSKFILDNWQVRIAEIPHCILPKMFDNATINEDAYQKSIKPTIDILFGFEDVKNLSRDLKRRQSLFWLTLLAYESDGNYFKTLNIIQDINSLYLSKLAETFLNTHYFFQELGGVPWERIMSQKRDNEIKIPNFNFPTIYGCIPIRKDKEKKNSALSFFKLILEQRKIDKEQIFKYFCELVLCHRYKRYNSYSNIYRSSEFDFGLEKAVFQYLAIIQVLEKLNLIKDFKNDKIMENFEKSTPEVSDQLTDAQKRQKQVDDFLTKMNYSANPNQTALFYLGRALAQIAYEQVKNKHKNKPILNKVNYHGLDLQATWKLYADLREKVVQYKALNVESNLGKFNTMLKPSEWKMSKEEAFFYVMSGYSFRIETEKTDENQDN